MELRIRDLSHGLLGFFELLAHDVALDCLLVHTDILEQYGSGLVALDIDQSFADDFQDLLHLGFVVLASEVGCAHPVAFEEVVVRLNFFGDVEIGVDGFGPLLLLLP